MRKIITSESVNCGHPDKTCDIIADAILDEVLKQDPYAQNSIECAIKDDLLMVYGESTTKAKININSICKRVLQDLGYKNKFKIIKKISKQSQEISKAVLKDKFMANDQGMMYGYACSETKEFMPLPIMMSHLLMRRYEEFRRVNKNYFSDAKSQVSIVYENDKPVEIATILVSVSHKKEVSLEDLIKDITENVIIPTLKDYNNIKQDNVNILINPSGRFTIWGSFSDSGCVGRKIIVDTYGGVGRVGGGCFSSKNATKVDRSGAYYARYVAKNIVANGLASKCEIQLSYAIGKEFPVSVHIDCFNTEKIKMEKIYEIVNKNFNFSVDNIIKELDLLKPIYKSTACYGHFGRNEFSWEKIIDLKG